MLRQSRPFSPSGVRNPAGAREGVVHPGSRGAGEGDDGKRALARVLRPLRLDSGSPAETGHRFVGKAYRRLWPE